MKTIQKNLFDVKNHITKIANKYCRLQEDITMLAVSKTQSYDTIQHAINAGQYQFGENYVQEGIKKIANFTHKSDLIWHFIGSLQSNKSRLVAEYFDYCHTVDRLKIAKQLNNHRPINKAPLNILIQINISNEMNKSGISPQELDKLAAEVTLLPNLKLRGLMAIPAQNNKLNQQILAFCCMQNLFNQLKNRYPNIDILSMGMTNDLDIAIACGSTLIRIGTAIFGSR